MLGQCAGEKEFSSFKLEDGGPILILHGLIIDCLAEDSLEYMVINAGRKQPSEMN